MWLEPDSFIYPLASWVYEAHQQVYHINNLFYDAVFGDFFFLVKLDLFPYSSIPVNDKQCMAYNSSWLILMGYLLPFPPKSKH